MNKITTSEAFMKVLSKILVCASNAINITEKCSYWQRCSMTECLPSTLHVLS